MFYEQRLFPSALSAWTELFAFVGFAEHYAEIVRETLLRVKHSVVSMSFPVWTGFQSYPQLSEIIPLRKKDLYLRGVGDPFSETFDPVSDLSQMRRVEERDEGFNRMVSEIETKMRVFDWGQRVCDGDRRLRQFECFLRGGSPVMRSFMTAYNEVSRLGLFYYYDEESEFEVQYDIMLEREWMRCRRQREESQDDSGEGWDKDMESEIFRRER